MRARRRGWSSANVRRSTWIGEWRGPAKWHVERPKGIEPSPSVWKTEALPLSYGRAGPSERDPASAYRVGPPAPRRARGGSMHLHWPRHGVWRSLVAHSLWERGAVGSNPATPTV